MSKVVDGYLKLKRRLFQHILTLGFEEPLAHHVGFSQIPTSLASLDMCVDI